MSIGKSVLSGFGVLFGPWPRSCFASLLFLDRERKSGRGICVSSASLVFLIS